MATYKTTKRPARENWPVALTGFAGDLDAIAREGAQRMLVSALEAEVTEFLGRQRYERTESSPGYRTTAMAKRGR